MPHGADGRQHLHRDQAPGRDGPGAGRRAGALQAVHPLRPGRISGSSWATAAISAVPFRADRFSVPARRGDDKRWGSIPSVPECLRLRGVHTYSLGAARCLGWDGHRLDRTRQVLLFVVGTKTAEHPAARSGARDGADDAVYGKVAYRREPWGGQAEVPPAAG